MNNKNIRFQAEFHELMQTADFKSIEDYCLYLIHRKAYEAAAGMADGKEVLDIGCNVGYGTNIIGTHCDRIIGVDVSQDAVKEAVRRYASKKMDFIVVDGMHLPFRAASFDMVVSCQVIEHINDYEAYFSEVVRVLRPCGVALFSTPNSSIRLGPGMKPWNPFHVREFNPAELSELLSTRFSKVIIKGLFAKEPLYSIELGRAERMRNSALEQPKLPTKLYEGMKLILPESINNAIRRLRRPNSLPGIDPAILQSYSTDDFFYADNDINQALDLFAMCSEQ